MILDDIPDTGNQILVPGEFFVLPARQPFRRSDPQASVACTQKREDLVTGKLFAVRRGPWNETHSVKADQSWLSPDPEITVRCLGNGLRGRRQIPILDSPHFVAVLGDLSRRIKPGNSPTEQGHKKEAKNGVRHEARFHNQVRPMSVPFPDIPTDVEGSGISS